MVLFSKKMNKLAIGLGKKRIRHVKKYVKPCKIMFKLKVETDGASILDVSDLVRQLNHDQDVTIMQKRINNPDGTHKEKTYR